MSRNVGTEALGAPRSTLADAPVTPPRRAVVTWMLGLGPLVLLGALLALLIGRGPSSFVTGDGYPPVERLSIERAVLSPGQIVLGVLNDGPDEVTIAQVMVDDAFWTFQAEQGTRLEHLNRTRLVIPYPWVQGESHLVRLITSTGATFDHAIGVAVETPRPTLRFFGVFALIGLYVGVIPVAIGLLWYPLVGRLDRRGLDFLLALTVGLLAFLFVDGALDGLESAAAVPESYQGVTLFVFGAMAAWVALDAVGFYLGERRNKTNAASAAAGPSTGWVLALLVAIGIGLHNFGEGLAIGSAFALGEMALGSLLIVGFTLHNTTEGLAIVAPLAREGTRAPVANLLKLGLVGGVPTIAGAWLGGFVTSPVWAVLMLGFGVGAIGQVMRQILKQTAGEGGVGRHLLQRPVLAGLVVGVVVMYVTGMFVG
ncbi:MAG: ZIP family metal transporter [Vicinamibacterales bacterium]